MFFSSSSPFFHGLVLVNLSGEGARKAKGIWSDLPQRVNYGKRGGGDNSSLSIISPLPAHKIARSRLAATLKLQHDSPEPFPPFLFFPSNSVTCCKHSEILFKCWDIHVISYPFEESDDTRLSRGHSNRVKRPFLLAISITPVMIQVME